MIPIALRYRSVLLLKYSRYCIVCTNGLQAFKMGIIPILQLGIFNKLKQLTLTEKFYYNSEYYN